MACARWPTALHLAMFSCSSLSHSVSCRREDNSSAMVASPSESCYCSLNSSISCSNSLWYWLTWDNKGACCDDWGSRFAQVVLATKASTWAPCRATKPIGCLMYCVEGPKKPIVLASTFWLAFAAAPVRVLAEVGQAVCGMWWVKESPSVSLEALWSRAPSVWSKDLMRGSRWTAYDGSTHATFFLGGIVRVFCWACEHGRFQYWD
jgi:hypothetical protein